MNDTSIKRHHNNKIAHPIYHKVVLVIYIQKLAFFIVIPKKIRSM